MMRELGIAAVGCFSGLAILGRYLERHDLDYSQPARRLRWMIFKEELRKRRKRKHGQVPPKTR